MGLRTKFDSNRPINSLNIFTLKRDQLNMKGQPELHILCNLRLNISWNVNTIKEKKRLKMNKIAHISVRDNRKSDFTEKPKALHFSQYFHLKISESMYNCSGTLFIGPYFWVRHLKKLAAKFWILPPIKKNLTQQSGPTNKVPEQL